MKKHDVVGIVMGVPALLAGIWGLAMLVHTMLVRAPKLEYGVIGGIPLIISIGLFIPSSLYDHGKVRFIGLVALALVATVAVYCAVFLGLGAYEFLSDPPEDGEMRWIMAAVAMFWCLIAFSLTVPVTAVLLKKVKPRPTYTAIAALVGIAAGLLIAVLM